MQTYETRPIQIQLLIDQLLRCYPYPKNYYEKMDDRKIKAFHKRKLPEMVRMTIENVKNPKPKQLTLF
jgi:hypothetical protein